MLHRPGARQKDHSEPAATRPDGGSGWEARMEILAKMIFESFISSSIEGLVVFDAIHLPVDVRQIIPHPLQLVVSQLAEERCIQAAGGFLGGLIRFSETYSGYEIRTPQNMEHALAGRAPAVHDPLTFRPGQPGHGNFQDYLVGIRDDLGLSGPGPDD